MDIEVPASGRVTTLDLAVGQRDESSSTFTNWLRHECETRGLSCAVLHEGVVRDTWSAVSSGRLRIGTLLDLTALWWHDDDPYVQLCYAV